MISDDALGLIAAFEVGDINHPDLEHTKAQFNGQFQGFVWNDKMSGPNIGIGYDLGYLSPAGMWNDWRKIIDDERVFVLQRGLGLKGASAHAFCEEWRGRLTVTWDEAFHQFEEREIPKWERQCGIELANYDKLSPDSAGALVSLVYDRGSFLTPGKQCAEMWAIKQLMLAMRYTDIPFEIIHMKRLWPNDPAQRRRRELEAALFSKGLGA